ncbi:MAG: NADH oxidase [Myxococcales bacterium]|nr:NADH oxidase [Myxococcales bacterium]
MTTIANARQLFTTVTEDHRLVLSIEPLEVPAPAPDEVVVEMRATPINPSDLGLLLAPADMESVRRETISGHPALVAEVKPEMRGFVAARLGKKLSAGNEGAGVVVAAGASDAAQALLGKTVTLVGGMMYRTHRVMKAREALPLPDGATPAEGASLFINPMTVQAFLETMRAEGHSAIVHTAAASNLGQMLAKLCRKEGVPLVAIVRSDAQRAILAELGVEHIVDSSKEGSMRALVAALAATGATLGFDAIGGGEMADRILIAMEQAQLSRGQAPGAYGTPVHKQVYVYGRLDTGPTTLTPSYGLYWGVGGWLVTPWLQRVGLERMMEMRRFAIEERNGIFASRYTDTIGLDLMIDPEVARAYQRKATGQKYLVDPSRAAGA